jgi:hypothetical protein
MADAYKCDRCKAFFDGKPFAAASVRPTAEAGETRFYKMVCEPCAEGTKKYIEGGIDSAVEANIAILQVLKNVGVDTECAACVQIAFTGTGANASSHTCGGNAGLEMREGPVPLADPGRLTGGAG